MRVSAFTYYVHGGDDQDPDDVAGGGGGNHELGPREILMGLTRERTPDKSDFDLLFSTV